MREKERKIKEHRTMQANDKKYMGLSGRLGTIAKFLGHEIVEESSGSITELQLMDFTPWPTDEETTEEMPTAWGERDFGDEPEGDDWSERKGYYKFLPSSKGWRFDGLSRGMHLEILYLHKGKRLTVIYKGYVVYEEKDGDLRRFAPFEEWENMIEILSPLAKEKAIKERKEIIAEETEMDKKKQADWITEMKLKWGL